MKAMTDFGRLTRRALLAGTGAFLATPCRAAGRATDRVRMSLEFRIYGANAPMFLAAEQGIYQRLGLDVTLDGSAGSDESIRRVAAGTHAFGLADATVLIAFAAANPAVAPKLVMPIFDRFPAVILSLNRKPVRSLRDLAGISLGTGTSDAGSRILPALLALNGIDPAAIDRVTVDVRLRDAMLLAGRVDAVVAFDYTAVFNLMGNGAKREDIHLLYFSDFGFDFISNALIVNPDVLARNPDLVRRVALATAEAWIAATKDRDGATASVIRRDRLLIPAVERMRLDWVLDNHVLTENVKRNGLGTMDAVRLERAIGLIKEGFGLSSVPSVDEIVDARFLPSAETRRIG